MSYLLPLYSQRQDISQLEPTWKRVKRTMGSLEMKINDRLGLESFEYLAEPRQAQCQWQRTSDSLLDIIWVNGQEPGTYEIGTGNTDRISNSNVTSYLKLALTSNLCLSFPWETSQASRMLLLRWARYSHRPEAMEVIGWDAGLLSWKYHLKAKSFKT